MDYTSIVTHESKVAPGVSYDLLRGSFGRRLELMGQVRELSKKREFHQAGDQPIDHMEVGQLSLEIDRLYFHWGLRAIRGLTIDGQAPTVTQLWEIGPLALVNEILLAIHRGLEFHPDEQKN